MSFTVPTTDGRCNEKRENGKDMQDDVRIASIFSLGKENEFFIHCNFFGGKGFKLLESVTKEARVTMVTWRLASLCSFRWHFRSSL